MEPYPLTKTRFIVFPQCWDLFTFHKDQVPESISGVGSSPVLIESNLAIVSPRPCSILCAVLSLLSIGDKRKNAKMTSEDNAATTVIVQRLSDDTWIEPFYFGLRCRCSIYTKQLNASGFESFY
ncbi:hypothetical protein SU86_001985 [Candidatus Nitrosotenuis cloacae]|uniref:Uncharacterized protein n=1 Tax=Candidatus Nitrosotenuis cloacae TaxID=1603555 RepID=A0A3G1B135_9ARCH|nr:hypothetical protein SU86_001985 [Candidatus Nitrosotenuis cloacae]